MSEGSVHVDPGTLERLANRLRQGEGELSAPAQSAPDAPDAGVSTGPVAGALSEITQGMLGLSTALNEVASRVVRSRGDYCEVDADNAAQLRDHQPN